MDGRARPSHADSQGETPSAAAALCPRNRSDLRGASDAEAGLGDSIQSAVGGALQHATTSREVKPRSDFSVKLRPARADHSRDIQRRRFPGRNRSSRWIGPQSRLVDVRWSRSAGRSLTMYSPPARQRGSLRLIWRKDFTSCGLTEVRIAFFPNEGVRFATQMSFRQ